MTTLISLNTCRNGRDVVWILLEDNREACVYVDNLKKLTNEEIKNQLL